jgi:pimeloyl-ACP methyl ester carboxylesterase
MESGDTASMGAGPTIGAHAHPHDPSPHQLRRHMQRLSAFALLLILSSTMAPTTRAQTSRVDSVVVDSTWRQLGVVLEAVRARNAHTYAITSAKGIDEGRYVELGGIEQWITIRGEDRDNPVLLFLHGGPGDVTNPWGYAVFRPWLEHFTVVQWDQRGAGRTLSRNGDSIAQTITIERLVRDGIELSEYLRRALGKEKIVLVGHSWGSILGVLMAKARPDLFHAYVGTGQVADPRHGYDVAYTDLLTEARRQGDSVAVRELVDVGPPPYANGRGYAVQRKWSNLFEGADRFLASTLGLALAAPGGTLEDVTGWLKGQGLSAERLVPASSQLEAATLGGEFAVPVFVIQGADDFTTPTSLARSFVQSLRAPRKEFVALEGGGHFAVFMQPEAFLHELLARVRPLIP